MLNKMTQNQLDEIRWQAVMERDVKHDGAFYFGVKTTGIYCCPSCPAKRAKRENVSFFASTALAEAQGYRACLRCHPKRALGDPYQEAIRRACTHIAEAEKEPTLSELAALVGLSSSYFQRIFQARLGVSPKQFARMVRQQRLRKHLRTSKNTTEAIFDAGYQSVSRAYHDGAAEAVARHHSARASETLWYASVSSALGNLVIAQSALGVCLLEFLDDDTPPLVLLQKAYPHAQFIEDSIHLEKATKLILQHLQAPQEGLLSDLALDVRGTVFQHKVWQALRETRLGETLSYQELAQRIGAPNAQRAVAMACAHNKIGVIIPCHRVIRADGKSSGYRWGKARKQQLLEQEKTDKNYPVVQK